MDLEEVAQRLPALPDLVDQQPVAGYVAAHFVDVPLEVGDGGVLILTVGHHLGPVFPFPVLMRGCVAATETRITRPYESQSTKLSELRFRVRLTEGVAERTEFIRAQAHSDFALLGNPPQGYWWYKRAWWTATVWCSTDHRVARRVS